MDDEAKIITSIIQLQTKKKRNVLDDILTIYENYIVRKVSNEDRKSTRLNSSHIEESRMPSSA